MTGAGKTTLVSLLTRFYDPTAGQVLLDGVDLRDYRLADLRNQFAIVLQEPVLFSTSIAENIAYARPGASEEEVVAAAKAANAHDFIARLPDGLRDPGRRARACASPAGERQRISLARAFLKDAPILILDEPTSSVDAEDRGRDHGGDGAADAGPDHLPDRPPPEHPGGLRRAAGDRERATPGDDGRGVTRLASGGKADDRAGR